MLLFILTDKRCTLKRIWKSLGLQNFFPFLKIQTNDIPSYEYNCTIIHSSSLTFVCVCCVFCYSSTTKIIWYTAIKSTSCSTNNIILNQHIINQNIWKYNANKHYVIAEIKLLTCIIYYTILCLK